MLCGHSIQASSLNVLRVREDLFKKLKNTRGNSCAGRQSGGYKVD